MVIFIYFLSLAYYKEMNPKIFHFFLQETFKDISDGVDDIFQICNLILKLVVYPRPLKKTLAF